MIQNLQKIPPLGRDGRMHLYRLVDDHAHPDWPRLQRAVGAFLVHSPEVTPLAELNRHGAIGRKVYLVRDLACEDDRQA